MNRVVALITGKSGIGEKNMWPLLGRPLCVYPILAAQHCSYVDDIYVSTDGPEMKAIARKCGVKVIDEPARDGTSRHVDCLTNALGVIKAETGHKPDILVVLLANVADHKWGLIDRCIEALEVDEEASACVPVVLARRYHPANGFLNWGLITDGDQHIAFPGARMQGIPDKLYFLTHSTWVLRVAKCFGDNGEPPWSFMGDKVIPMEVDAGQDIHDRGDLAEMEKWLLNSGWTDRVTTYDTETRNWRDFS